MTENEIATVIVDSASKVHTTLGPGYSNTCIRLPLPFNVALIKDGIRRVVNDL